MAALKKYTFSLLLISMLLTFSFLPGFVKADHRDLSGKQRDDEFGSDTPFFKELIEVNEGTIDENKASVISLEFDYKAPVMIKSTL